MLQMSKKVELPPYETVALVLQGGGALGSYQAGVYQGLHEAGIEPNWFAGISIGALNAAILGGNPPEKRLERLTEFWDTICQSALFPAFTLGAEVANLLGDGDMRTFAGTWSSLRAIVEGQRGFFVPRMPTPFLNTATGPTLASFYDTAPLKATLERLCDFDRINARLERVSVGAVDIETGNFEYFDNANRKLTAEHFMASGALPPGFPAVEIDGRFYWDGGLVSNTPLMEVLSRPPRRDTLTFRLICGRPKDSCRRICSMSMSAGRTSSILAVPGLSPISRAISNISGMRSGKRSTRFQRNSRAIQTCRYSRNCPAQKSTTQSSLSTATSNTRPIAKITNSVSSTCVNTGAKVSRTSRTHSLARNSSQDRPSVAP